MEDIPKQTLHEGNELYMTNIYGNTRKTKMNKYSSEIEISLKDFEDTSFDEIVKKIEKCGLELGQSKMQLLYNTMNEATEITGNTTNVNIESLSVDDFFNMLEMIEINFSNDGKHNLSLISNTNKGYERLIEISEEINNSHKLQDKYQNIMKTKYWEWHARENTRTLVG